MLHLRYPRYAPEIIVKNIPSFAKGTTDFLQKLDIVKNIPSNSSLPNLNVKLLYTNIPSNESINLFRGL